MRTPTKLAQLFRATKSFQKQKNCWTRRGTLSVRLWYIHWGLIQLKSSCGPRAMLSRFTSKRARHYALNWFNCLIVCPFRAKSGKYYSRKCRKLMQLGNCNDSNCVGTLSDQGEAATASSLSEYTMKDVQSALTYLLRPPEIFLSQPQGFPYTFHTLVFGEDKQSVNIGLIHRQYGGT